MDATSDIRPRPGPKLAELALTVEERATLERWARRRTSSQALAERCRIVLACAAGASNTEVAQRLGVARPTVIKWRSRFVASRLDGLVDEPRPGAPRKLTDEHIERVIVTTLETTPLTLRIVDPIAGAGAGNEPDRGQPNLAGVRAQAASDRGVQALDRPAVHRQGRRHRRAVSQPTPGRAGAVCG